ncbi:5-hydroxytryptamine receptor 1 [Clonorchis sinensis]|uniref:5-hydroxytryptamine receptor 1 n=1 Tax=Clonorchis sinensis TaxID=79923 RepID=H2KTU1_CLOSI|nr:5-hydroxytryptamine receptor 1 [Clonorchis sinensis]
MTFKQEKIHSRKLQTSRWAHEFASISCVISDITLTPVFVTKQGRNLKFTPKTTVDKSKVSQWDKKLKTPKRLQFQKYPRPERSPPSQRPDRPWSQSRPCTKSKRRLTNLLSRPKGSKRQNWFLLIDPAKRGMRPKNETGRQQIFVEQKSADHLPIYVGDRITALALCTDRRGLPGRYPDHTVMKLPADYMIGPNEPWWPIHSKQELKHIMFSGYGSCFTIFETDFRFTRDIHLKELANPLTKMMNYGVLTSAAVSNVFLWLEIRLALGKLFFAPLNPAINAAMRSVDVFQVWRKRRLFKCDATTTYGQCFSDRLITLRCETVIICDYTADRQSSIRVTTSKREVNRYHSHQRQTILVSVVFKYYTATFFTYIYLFIHVGYVNSTLNPIIYAIFNQEFRIPFKHLLLCHCRGINARLRSQRYAIEFGLGASTASCLPPQHPGVGETNGFPVSTAATKLPHSNSSVGARRPTVDTASNYAQIDPKSNPYILQLPD